MVDKRKRPSDKRVYSNTALPYRALLIRTIELLITLFYKKSHKDDFSHLKRWEREKVLNLGLTSHSPHPSRSPAKDINFTLWNREKVTNFGLTESLPVKNTHRNHHLPKLTPTHTDQDFTPKISPTQAWKNGQTQISSKNDNIDDFFKILGYE